ncbi:MAG: carbohydrate-binding domain-containing protein [Prevotella sp.]|nr:carbohydrate-binding domain-containing protein [Prevotella sp.]
MKKNTILHRRFFATVLTLALTSVAASAQTLNIVSGGVVYAVPAAQAGDMIYQDGTTLTVMNKTFNITDIDSIYIDNSAVTDDAVDVTYSGTTATVRVAGNIMQYLAEAKADGAYVTLVQSSDLAREITYTLSGTSDNGSFYMDGSYKATVVLNGLTLTSTDSAAVNIENGKRINLDIEGTNTLKDSESSGGKGALMVNGHSEITGSGTLNLYGYAKHAYWADEYVQLKASMTGAINVLYAAKDGLSINQYYVQNGGTVNISGVLDDGIQVSADDEETGYVTLSGGSLTIAATAAGSKGIKADGSISINNAKSTPTLTITNSGTGKWDSDDSEVKGSACLSSDANITIDAGTISLTATGNGGKGMSCDSVLTVNGGELTVATSGKQYVNIGGTQAYDGTYSGNFDSLADAYSSSPKGIKVGIKADDNGGVAVGDIQINGGTVKVSATGQQDGSEGMECKNTITISGGTVSVNSYDDAINAAKNIYIKGGTVTAVGSNNDGIDANANIYISGGTVMAYGGSSPECGLDAAEGYQMYFTGGTILAVGGSSSTPTSSSSTQPYVNTTGSVSANSTISIVSGSTTLASFTVPSTYSASGSTSGSNRPGGGFGGGMGGSTYILISTPDMVTGSSYTVSSGSSSSTATAVQYGSSRF